MRTRSVTLPDPTKLADRIFRAASVLLDREADGVSFRLIGVGVSGLAPADLADPPDLADAASEQRKDVEQVMDQLRDKFGRDAISKGR